MSKTAAEKGGKAMHRKLNLKQRIGLLTPPVGAVLFIGSAVAKRPMEKVVKATLPFYLCMFIALLLLTYIPDISLAIPKLLGGYVSPIANPLGPVFIH